MSYLFNRPNPSSATAADVEKALDEITEWDWQTGYSFAHIVIDDHNLSDKDILYCLMPHQVANVMNQRLKDEFGYIPDLFESSLSTQELGLYEKQIRHMLEVIDLLNWLLCVPEKVRNEIE